MFPFDFIFLGFEYIDAQNINTGLYGSSIPIFLSGIFTYFHKLAPSLLIIFLDQFGRIETSIREMFLPYV